MSNIAEAKTDTDEPARSAPEAVASIPETSTDSVEPAREPANTAVDEAAVGNVDEAAVGKTAEATAAPPVSAAGGGRTDAWAKIIADPGHSPELLALAAVQTIGPRAKDWAARIAEAYPGATPAGKARLASRQFTRFGSLSSVFAALSGSYAPLVLLGAAALTHADLVLHIAAAHGFDPTDEQRAVDLLVLTKVHPSRAEAAAALATAKQPAYEEEDGGITDAVWRLGRLLAAQAGSWTVVRTVDRLLPGTSLLTAVLTSRSSAQAVASRAHRFYSQESQAFGSSV